MVTKAAAPPKAGSPTAEVVHHMAVWYNDGERAAEELRQWAGFFRKLEADSKGRSPEVVIENGPLSPERDLSVLFTGRELFLGIYDRTTDSLCSECAFEDVKHMTSSFMRRLERAVERCRNGTKTAPPAHMARLWGRQIAILRAQEGLEAKLGAVAKTGKERDEDDLLIQRNGPGD